MAVTAPVPGFSLATLARWAASMPLPLPEGAGTPATPGRTPDVVVFSSAPSRLLSDLAVTGLRQLATLLPALGRAVEQQSVAPLGHLAKAVAAAARQVGEGHASLLAEGPDRVAAAVARPPTVAARPDLRALARQLGAAPAAEPDDAPKTATEPADPLPLLRTPGASAPAEAPAKAALRAVARELGMVAAPVPEAELGSPEMAPSIEQAVQVKAPPTAPRQPGGPPRPDLPAEPPPDAAETILRRWVSEAKQTLRDAGDLLDRAERQVRDLDRPSDGAAPVPAEPTKLALWATTEIVAAQAQVALAYRTVAAAPLPSERMAAAAAVPLARGALLGVLAERLTGGIGLLGLAIVLAILWLADGVWSIAAGAVLIGGVLFWTGRLLLAARGVRLDARR